MDVKSDGWEVTRGGKNTIFPVHGTGHLSRESI